MALVLANRGAAVEAEFERQYPGLKKGRPRQLSGSGYASGAAAGRHADLGGQRLSGRSRELGR